MRVADLDGHEVKFWLEMEAESRGMECVRD